MARSWTPSQEKAITRKGRSLLVSAAAGSGKTSVLTERIIRSLLDPEEPADLSRMLVVTFTRAAAAELKSRISQALSDALARDPANERLSKQLFLLGGAQISTIDSFFQKIVRSNFDALELPASFRIADSGEVAPIASRLMEGLISEFYETNADTSSQSAFERIISNPFAIAMDHLMSGRSDGKLVPLLLEFWEDIRSYPQGVALLQIEAEKLNRFADDDFFASTYGQVLTQGLRQGCLSYLSALQDAREYTESDPDAESIYLPLIEDDQAHCRSILNSLDGYCNTRAILIDLSLAKFPGKRNKPLPMIILQEKRAKWRSLIKEYREMMLPSPEEIGDQMRKTGELCRMLYLLYAEFDRRLMQEKRELGILEFNDIRTLLYRLLTDKDGAPSAFADSLAAEYDAVYIDEYQDVDFVQDGIFAMIGKDRRFMVGDIKQSIYGFRGGEPSIFAGYRKQFPMWDAPEADKAQGNCIFMSDNFRCDRPVVDFTNMVCSFLFSACEDSIQYRPEDDLICSKTTPEQLSKEHPVPVRVEAFEKKPRRNAGEDSEEESTDESREEVCWVGGEIKRLLREGRIDSGAPIAPSDIAVLVRTKAQGALYFEELKRLHIPVAMSTSSDVLNSPLLIDVVNLLRAVDNPYNDLPLSEFLISPLGGFDLEELTVIRQSVPASKALYDAMEVLAAEDTPMNLSHKTREMVTWLEMLRDDAGAEPADRFLHNLYLQDKLNAYAQAPELLFLYEQARLYQRSSWCGLYGFLQHFDRLKESGASAGGFVQEEASVSIMTVHHSKGLEFPVVFLCSAGAYFNKSDMKKNLFYHKNVGFCSKLYSPESGNTNDTVLRMAVKRQVNSDQNEENIRTLYVALTRAREQLIVTGTAGSKWESFLTNAQGVERGNATDILGQSSYLAWISAAWENEKTVDKASFASFSFHPVGSVEPEAPENTALPEEADKETATDPVTERYMGILNTQLNFNYPLAFLRNLPTMAAASKLRHDLLDVLQDEDDEQSLLSQIDFMEAGDRSFDLLLRDASAVHASDIGTATHDFLHYCDFSRLDTGDVESECTLLVQAGFLRPEAAELINKKMLNAFCRSDLMELIRSARRVLREQKFNMYVPMSELTRDAARKQVLADHPIFVQGFIDLLLETTDGRLILVDYKTDHITDAEWRNEAHLQSNMMHKHGAQLAYYAKAVKLLFGKAPDEVYIYSLPLARCIEMKI